MRGPDGGSRRDPGADRPDQMWQRQPALTDLPCKGCYENPSTPQLRRLKHRVYSGKDLYLICVNCDGGMRAGAWP